MQFVYLAAAMCVEMRITRSESMTEYVVFSGARCICAYVDANHLVVRA